MADDDGPRDPLALLRPGREPALTERWSAALDAWRSGVDARRGAAVVLGVAALLAAVVGAVVVWRSASNADQPVAPLRLPAVSADTASVSSGTQMPTLVVHAAGAVAHPGLFRLPPGSRVADLLEAAGGLSGDADVDRVNLAGPLTDGTRVYGPRVGEAAPPAVATDGSPGASGSTGTADRGAKAPLDLNTATAEQLDGPPGVGPSTAAAIVDFRRRKGPFRSVDALLDVPGIGPAKLEQLRKLVRV